MIKAIGFVVEEYSIEGGRVGRAELVADTSLEVEELGNKCTGILGLADNDIMSLGSTCFTANSELGVLNSSGNWEFQ